MASIARDSNGRKRILFFNADGERKTIRLGKATMQQAATVKLRIELLVAAKINGTAPDDDTSRWAASIGDDLHVKLAEHGLVAPRVKGDVPTLAQFVDSYIVSRSDVKPGTVILYQQTRRCLVEFFGAGKPLDEITTGETKDFRRWLTRPKNEVNPKEGGQGLSENTARKRCAITKQMFADAVDRELIGRSPFSKMEGLTVGASNGRDYFVGREDAAKVLAACPDAQWGLLFALSRYGGLRCPSEHLGLRWGDVDWDRGRIVVRSPKTEHHEGKAERVVPLFPELRPYLQAAMDELLAGFDPKAQRLSEQPVITRYRDANANLRTQLQRIIRKAGLTPWPKLFQNLRATRETELAEQFPMHVVCQWIGNSQAVAAKHYLQVTDAHYESAANPQDEKAAQNAAKNMTQSVGNDWQASEQECENPEEYDNSAVSVGVGVVREGFEPPTKGL